MAVGKAFGGGVMPAGACIANDRAWEMYIKDPFLMTTTFGGKHFFGDGIGIMGLKGLRTAFWS
jgi:acetylornithine/succinyldiaminopimelate/putrescine aminotransferase